MYIASKHPKKKRITLFFSLNIPILLCCCIQIAHAESIDIALQTVRSWVSDDFKVPSSAETLPENISGVCVLLWRNGDVLGFGEAFGDSKNLLSEAAKEAFKQARKHPIIRKLPEDIRHNALSLIGIEIEIATQYTPIPTKNLEKAAKKIALGVDGIAVRRGNNWDYRFPTHMRLSPFRKTVNHLEGMCIKVGAPAASVIAHQLPSQEDITIYKLDVVSAYQHEKGEKVTTLLRGDILVTTEDIKQAGLHALADKLASYLIQSVWPGEETIGITGTYQPEIDRLNTVFAPTISQAMSAEALLHYAMMPAPLFKHQALAAYKRIMHDLAFVNEHESPITGVIEQSFVVLASDDGLVLSTEATEMIANCKVEIVAAAKQMIEGTLVPTKALTRGVLAAAVSHIALHDASVLPLAETIIDVCFATTNHGDRASLIPWIAQASVDVITLGGKVDPENILLLRNNALASQIIDDSIPDLLGGFSLQTKNGAVVDARGIRMVPMLACLLPSETFTRRGERVVFLQSLLLASRFTSQLTTTPERACRFANPSKSIGGVRNSPWDATMKPEATAMALIGISEAIEAITDVAQGN